MVNGPLDAATGAATKPETAYTTISPRAPLAAAGTGTSAPGAKGISENIAVWRKIRDALNEESFEEDRSSTKPVLTATKDSYNFKFLGAGGSKTAYKIDDTNYVLLMSNAGKFTGAKNNVISEITTLRQIAMKGVKVPKPFESLSSTGPEDYAMTVNVDNFAGSDKQRAAYLQEYLSDSYYQEYKKRCGPEAFIKSQVEPNMKENPSTLEATLTDLKKTRSVMKMDFGWYDFQFMYNRLTGEIVVFDASEHPPGHTPAQKKGNQDKYLAILDTLIALCEGLKV